MKKLKSNQAVYAVIIIIICTIILILFDYYNLFTKLGIDTKNFNNDFLNLLINNVVIIIIFTITYFIINKKETNKLINQENYAQQILKECYKKCIDYICMLDHDCIKSNIKERDKFDSNINNMIDTFQKASFNEDIHELIINGIIDSNSLKTYHDVKSSYQSYISKAILLINEIESLSDSREKLLSELNELTKN